MIWRKKEPGDRSRVATERELAVEALERELHLPVGHHGETADEPSDQIDEVEPEIKSKSGWRWLRRLILLGMIGGGIGVVIIMLVRFADGPSQGTVNAFAAAQASAAPNPTPNPPNSLGGLYVEMQYLGIFDQVSRLGSAPRDLEAYMLSTPSSIDVMRTSMAVEVMTLPSGLLSDDPSYQMRKLKPTSYTPSVVTVAGEHATLMTSTDDTEQTLFWAHAEKELTVSITSSGSNQATIAQAMKLVLATARWKS